MADQPFPRTPRLSSSGNDWLGLAGIVSPAILTVTTIAVASGRPEYSHVRQTLSELGTVGRGGAAWMNLAGIIPAGVLVAVAAIPVFRAFGEGRLSRAGAIVLAAAGVSLAGTGVFPWVAGPGNFTGPQSVVHLVLAVLGLAGLALAPLLFALHARRQQRSVRVWLWPSLVAALGTFVFALSLTRTSMPGLNQRAAFAAFYLWLVAVSGWALTRPRLLKAPATSSSN